MKFEALEKSGLLAAMSDLGKEIILPQGIFYWSGRAKQEAEINATIGSAQGRESEFLPGGGDSVVTFYLPSVIRHLKELSSEKTAPYAPISGLPVFRRAWRDWIIKKLSPHYTFDPALVGRPTVVPGATTGLAFLAQLFLSEGDSIICHDKRWENYDLVFSGIRKLKVETVPLFAGGGMDVGSLADAVRKKSKTGNVVAVLNFPNNPTGYMPGRDEGAALRDEMIKTADAAAGKIVLLFDDAYEGYVYEESAAPVSLFGHFIGAHPNIVPVKCDGATKEFLLYGARIAAVTFGFHPEWGDPELLNNELDSKVGALIRGTISNSNLAFQHAVAGAIGEGAECDREREIVRKILAARYVEFKKALSDMLPGTAAPDPFNAGFFCFVNLERPAEEFADMLLKSRRVGVIPLVDRNLGINGIRIAFCSVEQSMIRETVSRISSALAEKA